MQNTTHVTIVRSEDRRRTATIGDDGDVHAPQLFVLADEDAHGDAINAVAAAIGEHPNAVDDPRVKARDGDEWGALNVYFRPNELPAVSDDGDVAGWLPPYRAEERVRETLMDELPEQYTLETQKRGHFVLAQE